MRFTRTFNYSLQPSETDTRIVDVWIDPNANYLFPPDIDSDYNSIQFTTVRSVKCWVLPRVTIGGSVSDRLFCALFAVPATSVTNGINAETTLDAHIGQKTTLVKPDYDVRWTLVGAVNFDKAFDSSVMVPYSTTAGAAVGATCLFRLALVDPDTGGPYYAEEGSSVQVMYEVDLTVPLPPFSQFQGREQLADSGFAQIPFFDSLEPLPAFGKVLAVTNTQ